jgi:hypothetical protein
MCSRVAAALLALVALGWCSSTGSSSRSPTLLRGTPEQCAAIAKQFPAYPKPLLAMTDTSTTCRRRASRASNDGLRRPLGDGGGAGGAVHNT